MHKKKHIKDSSASKGANDTFIKIIGGQWRSRKLSVLEADGLRPTGNRIRETLFNWLGPSVIGANVLDMFAGTGALGLEALSRGASHTTFIEHNVKICSQLKSNLKLLECNVAAVKNASALKFDFNQTQVDRPFDIVFVDPPFALNLWHDALERLKQDLISADALVYVEMPRNIAPPNLASWKVLKHKQTGNIQFFLLQNIPAQDNKAQAG